MTAPFPSPTSSSDGTSTPVDVNAFDGTSVWSTLLKQAATRRGATSTTGTEGEQGPTLQQEAALFVLGDKHCGKSSLLNKFQDRVSYDNLPSSITDAATASSTSSSSSSSTSPASLLASSSTSPMHPDSLRSAPVDYSYLLPAKNRWASNAEGEGSAGGKVHVWSMNEVAHTQIIPECMKAAATPATSSSSSPSAPSSSPLTFSHLSSSLFLITFDMSEPWRALDSVSSWLDSLSRMLQPALEALPADQRNTLTHNVSKYVQGFYTAEGSSSNGMGAGENGFSSPHSASSPASSTSPSASSSSAPPVDPSIPRVNLGVPILVVGLKADSFGRHLPSRSQLDEKFDFLTRKLRLLCLDYGATLIYTSAVATPSSSATGAAASISARKKKEVGVNVDVLQHYILHRLFHFPLLASSPSHHSSSSDDPSASPSSSPTSSSSPSVSYPPKVVGNADDDYAIYIPAGYDSMGLLDASSKNAVSAAYAIDTPVSEVLPNPVASSASGRSSRRATGGMEDRVVAEDNNVFFKQLKHLLEQGGGGATGMSLAVGLGGSAGHTRSHTSATGLPKNLTSPTHAASASISSLPPLGSLAEEKGTGAGAGKGTPAKGQIAVKQFFRELLSRGSAGEATNSKAAAAQKAVRANAEKELQRMTNENAQQ